MTTAKNARGGARPNSGRKPLNVMKKKQSVTIYIETSIINRHGGKDKLKETIAKSLASN
jgi:hypothetical protein